MAQLWQHDCPGKLTIRRDGTGLVVTCTVEDAAINLVQNGDFAQGKAGWSLSPLTSSAWSVTDGAARVAVNVFAALVQLYQTGIALTPGTLYRLTWKAKAITATALEVVIHQHGAPYTNYGLSVTVPVTEGWQSYTSEFVAVRMDAPVTDARLRFTLRNANQGAELLIDDVRLEAL